MGEIYFPISTIFIVRMKDGFVGLFDTKPGLTRQLVIPKVSGLYAHIQEQNKKGKKLFSGIVSSTYARNYTGRWIYFNKDAKVLINNLDNWENLILE